MGTIRATTEDGKDIQWAAMYPHPDDVHLCPYVGEACCVGSEDGSLCGEYLDHDRNAATVTCGAILDGEIRKALANGKYTRWAEDITPDQLLALICLVGEHCIRRPDRIPEDYPHPYPGGRRRNAAYNGILDFYREPFGIDETYERMRKAAYGASSEPKCECRYNDSEEMTRHTPLCPLAGKETP